MRKVEPTRPAKPPDQGSADHGLTAPKLPTETRIIDGVARRVTICPAGAAEGAYISADYWRRVRRMQENPMRLDEAAHLFGESAARGPVPGARRRK